MCLGVIGNQFAASENESIVRLASTASYVTVAYNDLDMSSDDRPKSCLRFVGMSDGVRHSMAMTAWRNRLTGGSDWFGQQREVLGAGGIGYTFGSTILRYEANLFDYSVQGYLGGQSGHTRVMLCNNVFLGEGVNLGLCYGPWTHIEEVDFVCNTVYASTRDARTLVLFAYAPATRQTACCNLGVTENGWTFKQGVIQATNPPGGFESNGNVVSGDWSNFGAHGTSRMPVEVWNDLPEVGRDFAIPTTLSAGYEPFPATAGETPPGVFEDFYGHGRGVTSAAGAVVPQ